MPDLKPGDMLVTMRQLYYGDIYIVGPGGRLHADETLEKETVLFVIDANPMPMTVYIRARVLFKGKLFFVHAQAMHHCKHLYASGRRSIVHPENHQ